MKITTLNLNNFRCFTKSSFNFNPNNDIIFITGDNGAGKTSILEALYYSCYLKSFRTHTPSELIYFDQQICSISNIISNIHYNYIDNIDINLNLYPLKRIVKLNQKTIDSCKELYNIFKIVTINADDLKIIQDGPIFRRNFIDQTIAFTNPDYIAIISKYKRILENRNALLYKSNYNNIDNESYQLWSEQFFLLTKNIHELRIKTIDALLTHAKIIINNLFKDIFNNYNFDLQYQYSDKFINEVSDFSQFQQSYPQIQFNECLKKRSLFGPHLDDININFTNKSTRAFASRGQQKLILVILKLAQISLFNQLSPSKYKNTVLLIDDFFSDFDNYKINTILSTLPDLTSQTFITSPNLEIFSSNLNLKNYKFQIITL